MRRFAVLLILLVSLSACGKKTRTAVPTPVSTRTSTTSANNPNNNTVDVSNADLEGLASYYAEPYHGRRTANGEVFDTYREMTAAHRTLPFNTVVRVTNKTNSETVEVRINDRGPFIDGRVIDLSLAAAQKIDMVRAGVVPVKLTIVKEGDGARVLPNPANPASPANPANPASPPSPPVYAVQVGAFSNQQSAEDLKNRLSRKFADVSVQTFALNQTTIYRVRIGNEPDLMAAQKLASQLKKEDLNPFVVRVN